jgi:hypothetical protein
MEYRYAVRSRVFERVEIWDGQKKYGDFETENWCSGGIFVSSCHNQIDCFGGKYFTIKCSLNPNLSYQASYSAIAVHKTNAGIGFKWSHRQYSLE